MNDHREITVRAGNSGSPSYGNSNNPYVHVSPVAPNRSNPMYTICDALQQCGKKVGEATRQAETMTDNFWNHLKYSASPADAAMARLVQGTQVLTHGGPDKLFQDKFGILPGEMLLKPYACYISTLSGPLIGTLYISTKRIAFCSDYPLNHYPSLQNHSMYYKVILQLDQVSTVTPSTNRLNTSEKYIQIITVDGYEFYFLGFIAYDKALKTLSEALQRYRNHSNGN